MLQLSIIYLLLMQIVVHGLPSRSIVFRVQCDPSVTPDGPLIQWALTLDIHEDHDMAVRRFTDASLRALKASDRRIDHWASEPSGFGVRVTTSGRKTFVLRYRVAGRLRRLTLGVYPTLSLADAQLAAKKALGAVALEKDPAQDRQDARKAETFGQLAVLYLDRHAAQKKSGHEDRRIIANELLPHWNSTRATGIRRRDVRSLVEAIADRPAPVMANRVQALISKIFNFGIQREIVEVNPCAQLERPSRERGRDRVLSDDELRSFWTALKEQPHEEAAWLRLRLVTAQRSEEVREMQWRDVDLDGGWWTIPATAAKNGLAHRVPLSHMAIDILTTIRERIGPAGSEPVFVLPAARSRRRRRAAIKAISLIDFQPSDLRRTAATKMAEVDISRLVIAKILNHVETGVTAVYDRASYDREKRQGLDTWARTLTGILTRNPRTATVVPFR